MAGLGQLTCSYHSSERIRGVRGCLRLEYPRSKEGPPDGGRNCLGVAFYTTLRLNDLKKLSSSILDDPPDMATFIAHVMTGSGVAVKGTGVADSQIVRMNPLVSPMWDANTNQWNAPGGLTLAQFQALAALDMDAIDQHDVETIADYADRWLDDKVSNQPIRMDGDKLKCEVGQGTFSAALAAWNAIKS